MSKIYEALQLEQKRRAEENYNTPIIEKTVPLFAEEYNEDRDRSLEQEMIGLYYSIESQLQGSDSRVVQFIGSQEGEGTSMVAHELARVVSVELRKSVLLFDADSKHKHLPAPREIHPAKQHEPSLEQLMNNETRLDALFQPRNGRPFLVCPISSNGTSPAAILNSTLVEPFFKQLKTHFDLVLLDSPPLSRSAHGLAMCRKTDGVVIVVEAENTKWPLALSNKEKIEKAGGHVLGIVLNKSRSHIPQAIQKFL